MVSASDTAVERAGRIGLDLGGAAAGQAGQGGLARHRAAVLGRWNRPPGRWPGAAGDQALRFTAWLLPAASCLTGASRAAPGCDRSWICAMARRACAAYTSSRSCWACSSATAMSCSCCWAMRGPAPPPAAPGPAGTCGQLPPMRPAKRAWRAGSCCWACSRAASSLARTHQGLFGVAQGLAGLPSALGQLLHLLPQQSAARTAQALGVVSGVGHASGVAAVVAAFKLQLRPAHVRRACKARSASLAKCSRRPDPFQQLAVRPPGRRAAAAAQAA
jgi:hypothetical protein